jgi:hypothetical protein
MAVFAWNAAVVTSFRVLCWLRKSKLISSVVMALKQASRNAARFLSPLNSTERNKRGLTGELYVPRTAVTADPPLLSAFS